MEDNKHVFVYIDGANLYREVKTYKWDLDYKRLYVWLCERYKAKKIYIFIGFIPANHNLYAYLKNIGFCLVFREVISDGKGNIKGNCDTDLVIFAMKDYYEHNSSATIVVSGDGDYLSLIYFFQEKKHSIYVLAPSRRCSFLLKKSGVRITYLENFKNKLKK